MLTLLNCSVFLKKNINIVQCSKLFPSIISVKRFLALYQTEWIISSRFRVGVNLKIQNQRLTILGSNPANGYVSEQKGICRDLYNAIKYHALGSVPACIIVYKLFFFF